MGSTAEPGGYEFQGTGATHRKIWTAVLAAPIHFDALAGSPDGPTVLSQLQKDSAMATGTIDSRYFRE